MDPVRFIVLFIFNLFIPFNYPPTTPKSCWGSQRVISESFMKLAYGFCFILMLRKAFAQNFKFLVQFWYVCVYVLIFSVRRNLNRLQDCSWSQSRVFLCYSFLFSIYRTSWPVFPGFAKKDVPFFGFCISHRSPFSRMKIGVSLIERTSKQKIVLMCINSGENCNYLY